MATEALKLQPKIENVIIPGDVIERYQLLEKCRTYVDLGVRMAYDRAIVATVFEIFYAQFPFLKDELGVIGQRSVARSLIEYMDATPIVFCQFNQYLADRLEGQAVSFPLGREGAPGVIQVLSGIFVVAVRHLRSQRVLHEHYRSMLEAVRNEGIEEGRQLVQHEIQQALREDPLTGLISRKGMDEDLTHALSWMEKHPDHYLYIGFMDLSGFKHLNDTYGHLEGDNALRHVAEILGKTFRPVDTIARLGGDEFVVILKLDEGHSIQEIFERVLDEFTGSPFTLANGEFIDLKVAFGVAKYKKGEGKDLFLDRADKLMLKAKEDSKGGVNTRDRVAQNAYKIEEAETKLRS